MNQAVPIARTVDIPLDHLKDHFLRPRTWNMETLEKLENQLPTKATASILEQEIENQASREVFTMMATTLGLALIVAQSVLGWQDLEALPLPPQPSISPIPPPGVVLVPAEIATDPVLGVIVQLQKSPRWRDRDRAAITLRHVDWRRHPIILGALSYSLVNDPDGRVREEAAESLAKMAPCDPVVHEALARAASSDPRCFTRFWARRGLKNLSSRCKEACSECGTATAPTIIPGPIVIGPIETPSIPIGPIVVEPRLGPPLTAPSTSGFDRAPSIDSSVGPPSELTPLPPPAEDMQRPRAVSPIPKANPEPELRGPSASASRSRSNRPKISMLLPKFLRPRSER